MPGFDGTGPLGKGSLTGRGKGYCVLKIGNENNTNIGKGVFDMPRGDGTGPMGLGPMTGRGAGYCAGYATPGYVNPVPSRGFGRGFGSFGRGAGRGRRNWYYATGLTGWQRASMGIPSVGGIYPYPPEVTPKEEMDILKNEADLLKKQLEDVQSRIEGLGKIQTEKNE
jgi:hypothetical protein